MNKRGAPLGNDNAAKVRENKGSDTTIDSIGRGKEYLIARIARDHPDLDVSGFKSVRQAAIHCGIVKVPTAHLDAVAAICNRVIMVLSCKGDAKHLAIIFARLDRKAAEMLIASVDRGQPIGERTVLAFNTGPSTTWSTMFQVCPYLLN